MTACIQYSRLKLSMKVNKELCSHSRIDILSTKLQSTDELIVMQLEVNSTHHLRS